ncbi:L-Ala-D/L-Glu epimerase [compost metagenome]
MHEVRIYHVQLPMRVGFGHPAATRTVSDSVVLELDIEGEIGLGECAPRSYVTGETCTSVCEALRHLPFERIIDRLRNEPPQDLFNCISRQGIEVVFDFTAANNVVCIIELAVLDWIGKRIKTPLGEILSERIHPNARGGYIKVSQVLDQHLTVEDFLRDRGPFHFVKVKANRDHEKDIETVLELRRNIGLDIPIVIDANMAWGMTEAVEHMRNLRKAGMTMVEEPLVKHAWDELRELRAQTGIPVMLDESISTLDDLHNAVAKDSCDVVNVRVSKCGGILKAMQLIEHIRRFGLQFQIGVQVAECGPLIQAGRLLADLYRDAISVEGGQSDRFFDRMVVSPAPLFDRKKNTVQPPFGFGLGLSITTEIAKYLAFSYSRTTNKWDAVPNYNET